MNEVEGYAREWIKRKEQDQELDAPSNWIKTIRSLVQRRIKNLRHCIIDRPESVLKDEDVIRFLTSLHD